jgi:hypothetical protein
MICNNKIDFYKIDFYKSLDVNLDSDNTEIIKQYKNKLEQYQIKIYNGHKLNEKDLYEVKLLKIAKYVLVNKQLRDNYNVLRINDSTYDITNDSTYDITNDFTYDITNDSTYDITNKFLEYKTNNVPLRKDKHINFEQLSERQFERFDHNNFDLTKDRLLRS